MCRTQAMSYNMNVRICPFANEFVIASLVYYTYTVTVMHNLLWHRDQQA